MRTNTLALCELMVLAEQEALFAAFRAPFHPLTLSHQLYVLIRLRQVHCLRDLLNFDDFFTTVLGKEDTWMMG